MAESKVKYLIGTEREDKYVRTHLPQGRWADAWDLFKSNFSKFVIINVLTLLFFVPGIAVVYIRSIYIGQMAVVYPFSSNPLFTYPLTPSLAGVAEGIVVNADLMFYSLLIAAGIIASIGIAGAMYSIRKLLNTHGQFTVKGYFYGIKACFLNVVIPATVFMVFIFGSLTVSDWVSQEIALGNPAAGPITAQVFIIIGTVLVGIIGLWAAAIGVSFKLSVKNLFKTTFTMLFKTILQTVVMCAFALIPVWILFIGMASSVFIVIGAIVFMFFGFSFILLCWQAYTQWVFDLFVPPVIKNEEEARRAKMTPKELAAEKENEEKAAARELLAVGRSELVGIPMRPVAGATFVAEVGTAYTRSDIKRVEDDRQKIKGEVDAYYEQHKRDARYVEYERLFAEREKALSEPTTGKKGKKKKQMRSLLNK